MRVLKAVKEAKVHTSWINEHHANDSAVRHSVEQCLTGRTRARFLAAFAPLWRQVAPAGVVNSLGQVVLKLASPGVPDFYQGCELWDLRLVDPDNRGPVDYESRAALLSELEPMLWCPRRPRLGDDALRLHSLAADWRHPRLKLLVTAAGMRCRQAHSATFRHGSYSPLQITGRRSAHVVAFAREAGSSKIVAAVTRLPRALGGVALSAPPDAWEDTVVRLPRPGAWLNALTGETLDAADGEAAARQVFATLPVALLLSNPHCP